MTAETRTDAKHEFLREEDGFVVRTRDQRGKEGKFDFVAVVMPPSGNPDYPDEVRTSRKRSTKQSEESIARSEKKDEAEKLWISISRECSKGRGE